jgi:hypothetical protein
MSLLLLDKSKPYLAVKNFIKSVLHKSSTKLYSFNLKGKFIERLFIKDINNIIDVIKTPLIYVFTGTYNKAPWRYYFSFNGKNISCIFTYKYIISKTNEKYYE